MLHETEAVPPYLTADDGHGILCYDGLIDLAGGGGVGGSDCYLGVYPISRIKHWYRSPRSVPDRCLSPVMDGGGVSRGRFVKITVAN